MGKNIVLKILVFLCFFLIPVSVFAVTFPIPSIELGVKSAQTPSEVAVALEVIALLTILTLAPAILILMTSFTRIIVVFHFLRQGMGIQTSPPNQVIVGLALFMTFFVMKPVWTDIYQNALDPYLNDKLNYREAYFNAEKPIKKFMLANTREKDLALFISSAQEVKPKTKEDVNILHLIPAFVISELKTAFIIGFMIYIPFIVIDMVVASVLLSMGMMMLPPIMISLPFKLMLFVLVDGWNLLIGSMIKSFAVP
ncbi:MAG: flagellar type III secretion system pore protein FliP [Desulforegulaceae bacterium]|jgi:flagellar biosynthetic protein FliP|nr:flagellar type III secretion system pore protein FliP [Desulforegulaceae bacterium]